MRGLFIILLIFLIAGAGYWHFMGKMNGEGRPPTGANPFGGVTLVTVYSVQKQNISDSIDALGTAFSNEPIDITAKTSETISEINFEDGQLVKKGDIIAVLEQQEEQAQLRSAQAQLAEHIRELDRLESLLEKKIASRREYDERLTLVEIAEQEVVRIKAQIDDRVLRAPFDGVLGLRRLSVGSLVQPGDVITTLDDTSQMKLDFNIPTVYLKDIESGGEIEARSESLGDSVFKGKINTIDTRIEQNTRSVLVRAIIPNRNNAIRPGTLMKVKLLRNNRKAIIVPEESIIQKQNDHFVMRLDDESKVEQVKVDIGTRKPGIIEITGGLEMEDLIIVRGIHKVFPGSEVSIKEVWKEITPPKPLQKRGE